MKRIITKFIVVILISILLIACLGSVVSKAFEWNIDNMANASAKGNVVGTTRTVMGVAITITRTVCMGVAFIMLTILGIKYMTSAPSDRASVVKHAYVYIFGAILMFASSGIIGIIAKFASQSAGGSGSGENEGEPSGGNGPTPTPA